MPRLFSFLSHRLGASAPDQVTLVGVVATALLGGVLGATGTALIAEFHIASVACAIACIGAAASAFFLIPDAPTS